jgi:hypothetical protein
VNKGSLHQNWTPLYVAAMQGHASIVAKLITHGADVDAKTEAHENALLIATAHGHSQAIRHLMEAGASKESIWMGLSVTNAAKSLRQDSALATFTAYESQFQGNITDEEGCICVASWPGIYCKLWCDKNCSPSVIVYMI